MTPNDEHKLYLANRPAWAKRVAPNWARMLAKADDAGKRRLWRIAGPELKAALMALKMQSGE